MARSHTHIYLIESKSLGPFHSCIWTEIYWKIHTIISHDIFEFNSYIIFVYWNYFLVLKSGQAEADEESLILDNSESIILFLPFKIPPNSSVGS